jgi:anti-sigma regulatory factor (Ser/Thr protein kinase)
MGRCRGEPCDDLVTVRIRDYGGWERHRVRDVGGRGLTLMQAVMDKVEVERAAEGTSVTLERHLMLR